MQVEGWASRAAVNSSPAGRCAAALAAAALAAKSWSARRPPSSALAAVCYAESAAMPFQRRVMRTQDSFRKDARWRKAPAATTFCCALQPLRRRQESFREPFRRCSYRHRYSYTDRRRPLLVDIPPPPPPPRYSGSGSTGSTCFRGSRIRIY